MLRIQRRAVDRRSYLDWSWNRYQQFHCANISSGALPQASSRATTVVTTVDRWRWYHYRIVSATVGQTIPRCLTIFSWFNFGMSYVSGSIAWRLPLAMQIVFSLIEKVSVLGVPESPRWLFTVGRHEEAIRLLALSTGEAEDSALVQEQTAEIKQALELEEIGNQTTWKKMFTQDSVCTRERVLLAFGCHVSDACPRPRHNQTNLRVQFMNQMGGINLVVYYIPSVLVQNVGMTPRLATILGGW